jgi:hypothetical protein
VFQVGSSALEEIGLASSGLGSAMTGIDDSYMEFACRESGSAGRAGARLTGLTRARRDPETPFGVRATEDCAPRECRPR